MRKMGVLVAISIPVFTTQLEKAREATDLVNIRSAYAEVIAAALNNDTAEMTKEVKLTQQKASWQYAEKNPDANVGGISLLTPSLSAVVGDGTVEVKSDAEGNVTFKIISN